ncbi:MAG: hypothetical protein A3F68_08035 [Acidobacteria bacterium RIFCSPLOWO2_12_FULL_54_10]|nr:MAG: hypothetical protein A3F68_08035 [Acidobacteria bacterium RIFCSPLOWO2_12_FULL_54_10]
MKNTLITLCAIVLIAFSLITLLHRRSQENSDPLSNAADQGKQRITQFWTLYNQANANRTNGDFEAAVNGFRQCLKLNPTHENSLYNLGTSLVELGDYQEAVKAFRQLIEVNPESNRGYSELGNTLALIIPGAIVDISAARAAYEQSVKINREQAGPFLQLGKLEFNQGNTDAAMEQFRVAAGFQSPEGNFWAGFTLFSKGNSKEASDYFLKVLAIQQHEKAIASRGVHSEGDILPSPDKPMSALEKSSLKSLAFLYWTSVRLGGYPAATPKEFHLNKPVPPPLPFDVRITTDAWQAREDRCLDPLRRAGHTPEGVVVDCVAEDVNGDSNPDLFLLRWRKDALLYLNQGIDKFSDATQSAGLSNIGGQSFSAVFFDYNRDHLPDLLVTAHAPFEEAIRSLLQPDYKSTGKSYNPRLFRNIGKGQFAEVTTQVGLNHSYGTMRGIAEDFDDDGWLDLLFVNGGLDRLRLEPSVVLRNLQGKEFREAGYLPSFNQPDNFIDATVERPGPNGKLVVKLVRNTHRIVN